MCLILFVYVLFHVFSYFTSENITIYEVNEGSINTANKFTALAIRDEELITTDTEGVVNYYQHSNSRIGVKSLLYSVDAIGTTTDLITKKEGNISSISSSDKQNILNNISSFVNDYNGSNFASTNSFKTELSSTLSQVYNTQAFNELSDEIDKAESNGEFKLVYGKKEGLFMMSYDGMEDLTIDSFTSDSFDINNSNKVILSSARFAANDPVGRLITSDKWYLVIPISKSYAKTLAEEKYIEVKFEQDGCKTWCESSIVKKGGKNYLVLLLDDSLERYADSRYLSVELLLNQNTGLKIPNSAIVTKEFYVVPKSYFLEGGDSNDLGLVVKGSSSNEFVSPTIYYESEDNYYIDDEVISRDATVIMPNSTETYKINSKTDTLQGVYNVNKGFAVFKLIEVLYQSNDYTIIKKGTNYGISLYDHIVLEGDTVEENQMINE